MKFSPALRKFLPASILFLLSGCLTFKPEDAVVVLDAGNRPNIILILADDLDEKLGTTHYMTNLKSYMIDRGVAVEDFLITTPMCCPSRVNLLRSQYTHSHEVFNNEAPYGGFPKFFETGREVSTLAVWLQAAGYQTALMGKYMNAYPLTEDRTYIPPGWSEWYSPGRKNAYDGYDYYLNENGELVAYGLDEENFFTDVMNRKAVGFIHRMAEGGEPFFLYLAPFAPHEPSASARRHEALLPKIQSPRTPSFNEEDVSDKPLNFQQTPLLNEEDMADIDLIYRKRVLSMLAVDEMIADLFQTLEETGELENTYVIFTSDQGFHLGQHRQLQGKSSLYEEDIIVPFVARGPGIPAGQTLPGFLAGIVDIAPTLAEWAGVVPPEFVVGRSFANALATGAVPADWRQGFLLERYSFTAEETGFLPPMTMSVLNVFQVPALGQTDTPPKWAGIRTLDYTYIEHPDGFVELYDLKNDPYQLANLAASADPELLARLSSFLEALETCQGEECRALEQGLK